MASNIMLGLLLITVPAKLDTAVKPAQSFKTLCVGQDGKTHDPLAITMPRTCTECGPITDHTSLKKGLKSGDGFAVIEQSEVAQAKSNDAAYKGKVQLVPHPADGFHAATAQGKGLYTVTTDAATADQYALIVNAVEKHPEWAFVSQYTPSSRAGLYVARVKDGILMLEERARQENLKPLPAPIGTADPTMAGMVDQLLSTVVSDFDPEQYADKYAAQITQLAATRAAVAIGGTPAPDAGTPAVTSIADLSAQLQATVAAQAAAGTPAA